MRRVYTAITLSAVCSFASVSFAEELAHDFQLKFAFDGSFEQGNQVEEGIFHPGNLWFDVYQMLIPDAGVFASASNGKTHSELYGGLLLRPFSGINCEETRGVILDLKIGIGLGAAGAPIVGGGFRLESDAGLLAYSTFYHHFINGWWNEFSLQARFYPGDQSIVEGWLGVLGRISGKFKMLPESLEIGPIVGMMFRWPAEGTIWFTWPLRREEFRIEPRFLIGTELRF